jgi:hypothetical protein
LRREHVGHYEDDSFLTAFLEELRVIGNATGNALIDTGWGLVTLGFGEPWNAFDTSGEGYARAYGITRVTFEVALGFGLGAAASAPGKLGKIAFAVDMAGNGTAVVRGGYGVCQDGKLTFSNGAELFGGLAGLGSGFLGKAFKSADEFAEGTESVDEIVESVLPPNCFVAGTLVLMDVAEPDGPNTPEVVMAVQVTADRDRSTDTVIAVAAILLVALLNSKRVLTIICRRKSLSRDEPLAANAKGC